MKKGGCAYSDIGNYTESRLWLHMDSCRCTLGLFLGELTLRGLVVLKEPRLGGPSLGELGLLMLPTLRGLSSVELPASDPRRGPAAEKAAAAGDMTVYGGISFPRAAAASAARAFQIHLPSRSFGITALKMAGNKSEVVAYLRSIRALK